MQYSGRHGSTLVGLLGCALLLLLAACGPNINPGGGVTSDPPATATSRTLLKLQFKCNDNPGGGFFVDRLGTHARVCVQTAPSAALTITVKFCNGAPDPSRALKGTVHANSKGYHEWNWKPQPDCKGQLIWRGEVIVKVQLDGQSKSFSTSFFAD